MGQFRKKPVVVEAVQFKGDVGAPEIMALDLACTRWKDMDCLLIDTLEGQIYATPGDWIITGIKGEKYPCKAEIFEATYDPVVEAA